ncbi:MAG TPA: platelet-activating factor acetylhydrolase IB subunit [Verrucomicrobiae bacterium]|nr:platelet-activating factor acetylhydrolase IB subunit [Verrucomicrobiae bacterium]
MKALRLLSSILLFSTISAFTVATAQSPADLPPKPSEVLAGNTAIIPVPRDAKWLKRHEGFLVLTKAGGINLLFLGDSITDGWRTRGSNVWNKCYAPLHAANFGIGGDRTQHVLWRLQHGELDGLKPKVVVLMIGTNNTGKERNGKPRNSIPEVIEGVTAVVKGLRARLPETKILLLGIFPRGVVDDPQRAQVAVINTALAKLDDGKMMKFLDIGPEFLEADGTLPGSIMPDLLHPNAKGYQIWADAMQPALAEMMK